MSCCEALSRRDFLEQKIKNFRAFLEPHCSTEELKAHLSRFADLDSVMPYLLQCVVLHKAGQLAPIINTFCEKLPASPDLDAVREKVHRYMCMFVDVLTTS